MNSFILTILMVMMKSMTIALSAPSSSGGQSNLVITTQAPVFHPKVTEQPAPQDIIDYEEEIDESEHIMDASPNGGGEEDDGELDLDEMLMAARRNHSAPTSTRQPQFMSNMNNDTRAALTPLFDFAEFVMRPTSVFENIVEAKPKRSSRQNQQVNDDDDDYDDQEDEILNTTKSSDSNSKIKINATKTEWDTANFEESWSTKDNVCLSKKVYEREGKSKFEYWFLNTCNEKLESEFCYTKIQAGLKGFEIHSTVSCCPNFNLDSNTNSCEPSKLEPNLYELLKSYMVSINTTVQEHFKQNESTTTATTSSKSKSDRLKFTREINSIYNELTRDVYNRLNSTRLTVFLWDNSSMIEHVKNLLTSTHNLSMTRRLEQILDTVRYHIVRMHHATHSIYSNTMRLESLARKVLRLSANDLENKSVEFVNCRELVIKNQYHKRIDDSLHHNYHLLIHQLQPDSLLVPQFKSVFQVLTDKLTRLLPEPLTTTTTNQSAVTRFSTFAKVFAKCRDLVEKELNKPSKSSASLTVFMPTDAAFKSLRRDQIESLWADRTCAFKFVMQNIVSEEICPAQLVKYGAEYSSRTQKADLIAVGDENDTTNLYFNGQKVNTAKSYPASNGVIYRLSSLQLAGVVDFLYDIVVGFKKKFATQFIDSLSSNWLETLRNESKNVTLFMPFEGNSQKNLSMIFNTTKNGSNQNTPISIRDYITKPRLSFYELNNGDVLTSLSGHKYLISTYPFESSLSELIMRLIPRRNLERKSINCQQLEVPDLSACNAQLIVFKSDANRIPHLNTESLLDFIRRQSDLTVFASLLRLCGADCNNLLSNNQSRSGYTVLLPTNEYFNKALYNFQKFSNSMTLFKRSLQANMFRGTYCGFYLKYDVLIENRLERKVKAKRVSTRLVKTDVYLSKSGIVAHKVHDYF